MDVASGQHQRSKPMIISAREAAAQQQPTPRRRNRCDAVMANVNCRKIFARRFIQ
jgi:hypothetical protein